LLCSSWKKAGQRKCSTSCLSLSARPRLSSAMRARKTKASMLVLLTKLKTEAKLLSSWLS
jgi:hypothetical protein